MWHYLGGARGGGEGNLSRSARPRRYANVSRGDEPLAIHGRAEERFRLVTGSGEAVNVVRCDRARGLEVDQSGKHSTRWRYSMGLGSMKIGSVEKILMCQVRSLA